MAFRIFDHVLADHAWSATGFLCLANAPLVASCATGTPRVEIASLRDRLITRSKSDRVMCRAAKRLLTRPAISFDELARELGVTPRYLLAGLRAVFGVEPDRWRLLHEADAAG